MNTTTTTIRYVGTAAGTLVAAAGIAELIAGSTSWTGDKNQPTALGLLTVGLGVIIVASAYAGSRSRTVGAELAAAGAMAAAGLISLTTAGLVAIPGAIVSVATAGIAFDIARRRGHPLAVIAANWPLVLLTVLGVIYLAFGAVAGPVGLLGIAGAGATAAAIALAPRSRRTATIVLTAGAVPFALAVWWSVVIPLTGLLIVAIGLPQIKRRARAEAAAPLPLQSAGR